MLVCPSKRARKPAISPLTGAAWIRTDLGASESLREGLDELFTVKELGVPEDLERVLSTTNAIENVNNGIRRITRRVKRWRGGTMILRWLGAALQELQAGFHRIKGYRGMKDLEPTHPRLSCAAWPRGHHGPHRSRQSALHP